MTTYTYTADNTAITTDDGRIIPLDTKNRDYAELLQANTVIQAYTAPTVSLSTIEMKLFRYTLNRAGYRTAFDTSVAANVNKDVQDYFTYSPNVYLQNKKFLRVWAAIGKSNTDLTAFVTLAQQIMAE